MYFICFLAFSIQIDRWYIIWMVRVWVGLSCKDKIYSTQVLALVVETKLTMDKVVPTDSRMVFGFLVFPCNSFLPQFSPLWVCWKPIEPHT